MTPKALATILLFAASLLLAQETPPSLVRHDETVPSSATTATPMLRVLRRVLPAYPKEARKAGIEGPVVLHAVIADDGTLVDLEVVSGDPVLASAAMEAARQWQFEKPTPRSNPHTTITMNFDWRSKNATASVGQAFISPPSKLPDLLEGVLRVGGKVGVPRLIYDPPPDYPEQARKDRVEGEVLVELVVTAEGSVREPKIAKSLRPDMDASALGAVRQWKFDPATKDGVPVAVRVNVDVRFRLTSEQ